MEAAALSFAIFDAFHHIANDLLLLQAVKTSGESLQASWAILRNTQLQLTRWGEAVGLNVDDRNEIDSNKLMPEIDREQARDTLLSMKSHLERAKNHVDRNMHHAHGDPDETFVPGGAAAGGDIDTTIQKLLEITLNRCKKAKKLVIEATVKTRWAVHDRKIFKELLDNILVLMGGLEKLFPSSAQTKVQLAEEEVRIVGEEQMIHYMKCLKKLEVNQDKVLTEVLKAMEGKAGSSGTTNSAVAGDYCSGLVVASMGSGTINFGRP